MLALLLAMGGAWAQTDYYVVGNFNGWSQNDSYKMTYTDYVNAYTLTLDLSTSDMLKVASTAFYPEGMGNAYGENGEILADGTYTIYFRPQNDSINWFGGYFKVVAGTLPDPPAQPIKLTPDATGKVWTLDETPDYNLDLNVVYYQKYALKEIPANWQVKVDGVDKTAAIDGDSLKITETAQVILTPDHPERVKKVILVDEAVLVNIDGITLDITGCTTWAQIIARNPGVIEDDEGWIASERGFLNGGGVSTSDPYDPAQQSNYKWQLI